MTKKPSSDLFPPDKRSDIMRAVKSANTKPEVRLRKAMHARGFRYRLHGADLPGKPDLVFPKYRAVIFVHGCFWHGHSCKRGARTPKTNTAYWKAKITRNMARDNDNLAQLKAAEWRTHIVWECELRDLEHTANRAAKFLRSE